MTNPHKGHVPLQAGDTTYQLVFSVNSICELEDLLNQPVAKIAATLNDPENVKMSTVRALVWAAMRDFHDEVTVKQAGTIATQAGVPACMEAIGDAFRLAFPDQEGEDGTRPPKAKAG